MIRTTAAADVDRALMETAWRLAEEYGDVPTGSVLRCFARAVRRARGCGVALADLPAASERIARAQLRARQLHHRPVPAPGRTAPVAVTVSR